MSYKSPRTPGSTPIHDYDSVYSRMSSATPTPSPRPTWADSTPRRPATRAAHSRFNSYSQASDFSPRPPKDSPRYNSIGQYSTADVSHKTSSSRRLSESSPRSKRDRRFSFTYVRASTPYGESDEDEIIEALGHTYCFPHSPPPRSIITANPLSYLETLMMTGDGTLITTTTCRVLPPPLSTMTTTHESRPLLSSRLSLNLDLLPVSATAVDPPPRSPLPGHRLSVPLAHTAASPPLPLLLPRPLMPMLESTAFLLDTHSRTGTLPKSPSFS